MWSSSPVKNILVMTRDISSFFVHCCKCRFKDIVLVRSLERSRFVSKLGFSVNIKNCDTREFTWSMGHILRMSLRKASERHA